MHTKTHAWHIVSPMTFIFWVQLVSNFPFHFLFFKLVLAFNNELVNCSSQMSVLIIVIAMCRHFENGQAQIALKLCPGSQVSCI